MRSRIQIKKKYDKEQKKHPEKINSLLSLGGTMKIEQFEQMYGKISIPENLQIDEAQFYYMLEKIRNHTANPITVDSFLN